MGVRPSMGSVGYCFDNAVAESFFATLECELIEHSTFRTHAAAELGYSIFSRAGTTKFHAAPSRYVVENSKVACPAAGIAGRRLLLVTRSTSVAAAAV
jgi:transposase InsO family protein